MKIVVIEDHTLVRDLLVKACREVLPGSAVSGARDAAAGISLCRAEQPDIVLLDLGLPDRDGLDTVDDILAASPGCKLIGLSSYNDEVTLHRALRSKLHGFLDKNDQPLDALGDAIRAVLENRRYLSTIAQQARLTLRNDPVAFDKVLSDREQTLLSLFGRGLSNHEAALELGLSENTVRNHRSRIMARLGFHTSPELMRYALEKGFTRREQMRSRPPAPV